MEMLIKKFNSIARSIAKLASFPKVKEEKYNNYFKKIINDLIDNPKSSLEDISAALLVGLIPKVEMVDVKGGILPESSNYPGKKVKNFKVSKSPITLEEWKTVANWAKNIGFKISSGDASDSKKPVNNFTKQDAIHWCNAKSIMDELAPAYTTEGFTNFSKNHPSNKTSKDSSLIPNANGYRLLSELEQEYVSNKHPKGLRLAINTKNNSTDSFEETFVLPSFLKSRLAVGLLITLALPCAYLTFKIAEKNPLFWTMPLAGTYYGLAHLFDIKEIHEMDQRSVIYDRDAKYYSRLAGENRVAVPFDKVPQDFYNALISREDTRFYSHHGIDPFNYSGTITQNLIKQTFKLSDLFYDKLITDFRALRIEKELTKEEILEAYVNRIYFGSDTYGIEAASQIYFGKPASKLNLPESATLVGLIRNPNRFSPLNNPDDSLRERNNVLGRMRDLGFITTLQYDEALASPLLTMPRMKTSPEDNWAMDAILRELELVLEPGQMNEGGLKIYTTIDGPLQAAAEQAVRERLQAVESQPGYPHKSMSEFGGAVRDGEKSAPYLQAAVLVLENSSGGIRCIVGGRDYEKNRFNRVATSRREAGSIIMPFVYACAFDAGMTGDQIVSDDRIEPGEIPKDFGNCDPLNLDNSYRGPQPASEGLIESRNIMTVRVGMLAGMDRIANMVVKAGITDEPPRLPLTCLGLFDSTLKDLTAAYTIFPNKGEKVFPHVIDRVLDNQGNILYQNRHNQLPVTSAEAAQKTGLLLNEALSRAASDRTKEFVQFAGKIGLSSDFCDSWCIGYNTDITCGVWLGFDNKKPMNDKYISRNLAIPLWLSIISYTKNKQNNSDKNLKSMPKQEKSPINKSSKH